MYFSQNYEKASGETNRKGRTAAGMGYMPPAVISLLIFLDVVNISTPTALVTEVHRTVPVGVAAAGRTLNAVGEEFGMIVVVHRFDSPSSFIAAS